MIGHMGQKRGQWETLSSKIVHKNPYYWVREDTVIKPDGSKGFYNVVESNGAVFIVALDDKQNVYLIGLHRYTNDNYSIELPAGGMGDDDPLTAAKRELQEETGMVAKKWKELGLIYPANGLLSENNYVFIATDLHPAKDNEQKEEGIDTVLKVPFKEAFRMIKRGEINDTQTIAPLTMAALELGYLD